MSLFEHQAQQQMAKNAPLADRMRPRTFDEFVGQEHVVGIVDVQDPGQMLGLVAN